MLRGEHKVPYCTGGVAVRAGRKLEAVDSDGVDTSENRPKSTVEGGRVTGVMTVESAAVDKNGRDAWTEDDRAVFGDEDS
jgi:hypothetical protein